MECRAAARIDQSSPSLTFKQEGEKLTGTYQGYYGASPLEGQVKEKEIAFTVTTTIEGSKIPALHREGRRRQHGRRVEFEGAGSGKWSPPREVGTGLTPV